jgi:hypothetical protein
MRLCGGERRTQDRAGRRGERTYREGGTTMGDIGARSRNTSSSVKEAMEDEEEKREIQLVEDDVARDEDSM